MELVDNYAKFRKARKARQIQALKENVFGPGEQVITEKANKLRKHKQKMEDIKKDEEFKDKKDSLANKKKTKKKIQEFAEILKGNLIAESFKQVFDQVATIDGYNEHQRKLGYSVIENFVKEQGAADLLQCMDGSTVYLSLYANAINDEYKSVIEACACKAKDCKTKDDEADICYTLDKDYADKFVKTIQCCTPGKLSNIISKRVEDAVTSFIDKNSEAKQDIKNIYNSAKSKISSTKNEGYIEDYTHQAKKQISKIYNEKTNLYGAMVKSYSEEMIKSPEFKNAGYVNESGSLNVGKVMNDTRVMYTVLEMFNTMGAISVDADYIRKNIL